MRGDFEVSGRRQAGDHVLLRRRLGRRQLLGWRGRLRLLTNRALAEGIGLAEQNERQHCPRRQSAGTFATPSSRQKAFIRRDTHHRRRES
jgi:hypothetical protein